MGLFDNALSAFLKLTDPRPNFTGDRCLLERNSVDGCDKCEKACPHEAISLESYRVEISDVNCTGCGICTNVCPSFALEYPLGTVQEALTRNKGRIRCSKVAGSGDEVRCLGQLTAGVLADASSKFDELTLLHGPCTSCNIGSADVPALTMNVVLEARKLVAGKVLVKDSSGEKEHGVEVGRRDFFGAMLGGAKRKAAELLPSLPEEFLEPTTGTLPQENRLRAMAAKRSEAAVWPSILVGKGCTLCPVCENVCPTNAIKRSLFDWNGSLELNTLACTGCNACVVSCPPQVITLEPVKFSEIGKEPLKLFEGPVLVE